MDTHSLRLGRTRATLAALAGVVAVLAACEAKTPTAADIDRLNGASAESTAHKLGLLLRPVDTAVAYKLDGVSVRAEEARAIPADDIGRMAIAKASGGQSTVEITRKAMFKRKRPVADSTLADVVVASAVAAHGGVAKEQGKWPTDTAIVWFLNGAKADASVIQTLDGSQIDAIDVLKGPAAEQEFGVAAGKSVVSIRTKR